MKNRYIFLWFLTAFLLQSGFVLNFGIMGLAPNFILCVTILFAFYYESSATLVFALVFGLLQDVNFSVLIGPSALILALIALAMNPLKNFFYKESMINVLMISSLGTIMYYGLMWLVIKTFKGIYTFAYMAKNLPALLVMNTLVMFVLYFVLAKRLIALDRKKYI